MKFAARNKVALFGLSLTLATTLGGDSQKLSTPPDRTRFLGLHRSAAAIIVGKNSAVHEDYRQTQVPIFIFSRSEKQLPLSHPSMQQILIDGDLAERSRQIEDQILGDVVATKPLRHPGAGRNSRQECRFNITHTWRDCSQSI